MLPVGVLPALVLLGCLPGAGPPDASAGSLPPGPRVTAEAADSLLLRVDLPEEVDAGMPVPITLTARNITDRTLDLYLTGDPVAFDLTVTDEAGAVAWRRLEGVVIPMVLRIESLPPEGDPLTAPPRILRITP